MKTSDYKGMAPGVTPAMSLGAPGAAAAADRRYDIDWLRIGAVLLLFPFHVARIFNLGEDFYVRGATASRALSYIVEFLNPWHMPLLFLLAGASTWFALSSRGAGGYALERVKRLLVPFIFGFLVLVPPQAYLGMVSHGGVPGSYLSWWPSFFHANAGDGGGYLLGGMTFGHLWFILHLFVYSMVALPIVVFLRRKAGRRVIDWLAGLVTHRGVILALFPLLLCLAIPFPDLYGGNPVYLGLWFLFGYIVTSDVRFERAIDRHKLPALLLGFGGVVVIAYFEVRGWPAASALPTAMVMFAHYLVIPWFCLVALLGYGRRFLSFSNRFLRYAAQASYPIYLLHQTVIVAVGFVVLKAGFGAPLSYTLILAGSLASSFLAYDLAVRRLSVLRFLFGMKGLKKQGVQTEAASVETRPAGMRRLGGELRRLAVRHLVILGLAVALGGGVAGAGAVGCGATGGGSGSDPDYWPTNGWQTAAPETQGLDSATLAQALAGAKEKRTRIHSLLIIRHGYVVLDAYFYPYDGSTYHDLASVTKSFTTTLAGIAADQGKLSLDEPVLPLFGGRTVANRDALKEQITVRDLASMSSGLLCKARPQEVTLADMQQSPDFVQFALDRKAIHEPGTSFTYSSPGMHLLSAVLQEATGMTALDFARANLFGPLGIDDVYWPADPQGYTHGWGDLSLRPRDAAKLGFLFLNGGRWDDRQIVSKSWVESATTTRMETGRNEGADYGYGWWTSREDEPERFFSADGRGGQYVRVYPELELIVVMTGGGCSVDDILLQVAAAASDDWRALPANPAGEAELAAVIADVGRAPEPQPVVSLPAAARAASGTTYVFEANPVGVQSLKLEFAEGAAGAEAAEALMTLSIAGEPGPRVSRVGMDGVFRPATSGRPAIACGSWKDDGTLVIEYSEGPGLSNFVMTAGFHGDRLDLDLQGAGLNDGALALVGAAR